MTEPSSTPFSLHPAWKVELRPLTCGRCQWTFLVPAGTGSVRCPHCHLEDLDPIPGNQPEVTYPYPPELVVPFHLSQQVMEEAIHSFSKGIPFAPDDLSPVGLRSRLAPLYLPMWLVDSRASATWQAEAGFDYEVISHQESYHQDSASWQTREVKEGRVRWENRAGRIERTYQNIQVPALDDAAMLRARLGQFQTRQARPYEPGCLDKAFVRLPDHTPEEAWGEATAAFQTAAAEECRAACGAGHMRQFTWKAHLDQVNWTLMLLPVYSTYYLDDQGAPQPVLIHGQTGQIDGARRASMRKARNTSLSILLLGILLFLLGLVLEALAASFRYVAGISPLLILCGIGGVVGAFVPYLSAWDFNRKQERRNA